jgi:hypothetical protein
MPDPDTLLALAARAEAGGDATLSDDVWRALGWQNRHGYGWRLPPSFAEKRSLPDLTRSIDAQAELPGRILRVVLDQFTGAPYFVVRAEIPFEGMSYRSGEGKAYTEILARLAARLRAIASSVEER